jgi:hypothetical protein
MTPPISCAMRSMKCIGDSFMFQNFRFSEPSEESIEMEVPVIEAMSPRTWLSGTSSPPPPGFSPWPHDF